MSRFSPADRHRNRWSKRPLQCSSALKKVLSRVTICTKWPPKVIKILFIFFSQSHLGILPIQIIFAGYVSFVRSYAALPKDVRDVFNFQSLHLGHYAKSFALRDPPARINSAGRIGQRNDRTQQFNTARQRNPAAKRAALAAG